MLILVNHQIDIIYISMYTILLLKRIHNNGRNIKVEPYTPKEPPLSDKYTRKNALVTTF